MASQFLTISSAVIAIGVLVVPHCFRYESLNGLARVDMGPLCSDADSHSAFECDGCLLIGGTARAAVPFIQVSATVPEPRAAGTGPAGHDDSTECWLDLVIICLLLLVLSDLYPRLNATSCSFACVRGGGGGGGVTAGGIAPATAGGRGGAGVGNKASATPAPSPAAAETESVRRSRPACGPAAGDGHCARCASGRCCDADFEAWAATFDGDDPVACAALFDSGRLSVHARDGATGATLLHRAARSAALPVVRLLLDWRAAVDALDVSAETPLHAAARQAADDVCGLLLDEGADIDAENEAGWTPLHVASLVDHRATCRLLLGRGATLGAADPADVPTWLAAEVGSRPRGVRRPSAAAAAAAMKATHPAVHTAAAAAAAAAGTAEAATGEPTSAERSAASATMIALITQWEQERLEKAQDKVSTSTCEFQLNAEWDIEFGQDGWDIGPGCTMEISDLLTSGGRWSNYFEPL